MLIIIVEHARLARLNLNLLVTLDALLEERNVSRAATRLGVTQSAVSHALRQLREHFGDPILVRVRGGMAPTTRAKALAGPVRRGLLALDQAMDDQPGFDPQTSTRSFTLASTDLVATIASPALVTDVSEVAPRVGLQMIPAMPQQLGLQLENGEVDLALVPGYTELATCKRRKLFEETFSCLVRTDHPRVGKRLTLERYIELGHVLISPTGEGRSTVDPLLAERGLTRHIAYRVRYFTAAPFVIADSDLVLTAPTRLCRLFAEALPLRVLSPPLPLPRFTIYAYWHPRWDADPGHRWFRERVVAMAQTMTEGTSRRA